MKSLLAHFAALLSLIIGPCFSCLCCQEAHAAGLQAAARTSSPCLVDCLSSEGKKDQGCDHSGSEHSRGDHTDENCCSDCAQLNPAKDLAILPGESSRQKTSALEDLHFNKNSSDDLPRSPIDLSFFWNTDYPDHFQNYSKATQLDRWKIKLRSARSKAIGIRGPPMLRS